MRKADDEIDMPSDSLMEEISIINNQLSSVTLKTSGSHQVTPFLTLPVDLIEEILCRLQVKLLLQLRCVCKLWNSIISDPKFSRKHLSRSTTPNFHFLSRCDLSHKLTLKSYPLPSVFNNITTSFTQLEYLPSFRHNLNYIVGSCDGILCLANNSDSFVLLWNPSIRKFKELPAFEKSSTVVNMTYGIGYDSVTNNYKVVVVLGHYIRLSNGNYVDETEVKVHTLGTNFWKNVQEFPFDGVPVDQSGQFVSGTINWLTSKDYFRRSPCFIVSFDLGNESYKEILQPDYEEVDAGSLRMSVLRDCLCILSRDDVWVMKEYGNKESWTKLFTISYMQYPRASYGFIKLVNVFEDDKAALDVVGQASLGGDLFWKLIVYDSKNRTFMFTNFTTQPEISVESLISPCF